MQIAECAQSKGDVLAKAVTYLERVAAERDSLHEVLGDLSRLIAQYNALASQLDLVRQENLVLRYAFSTRSHAHNILPLPSLPCVSSPATRELCRRPYRLLLALAAPSGSSRSRPGPGPEPRAEMQMQMLLRKARARELELFAVQRATRRRCVPEERSAAPRPLLKCNFLLARSIALVK